jgi:O-antigen ligase
VGTALVFSQQVLRLLGKSSDLTNRAEIWHSVIQLAQQRPVFGWGWVSYWVPWVAPFDHLAENNGVRQLHAHDAWLDVWLQLGIIGLVVMGALVLSSLARSWSYAVDRPQLHAGKPGAFTSSTLLPLLVLVALLVQSIAESRLLVESGMFLLALIAIKTKMRERAKPGSP